LSEASLPWTLARMSKPVWFRVAEAFEASEAAKKRLERAARRAEVAPAREIRHEVPAEARHCQACGSEDLKPLGKGRASVVYEYVPARFEQQVQEVLACTCGRGVVAAPPPPRVVGRGE